MEAILIEPTEFSPGLILDPVNSKFEIYGESRPENARKFFEPAIKWLEDYRLNLFWQKEKFGKTQKIVFEFKFDYFNSTSGKFILDILKQLDKYFLEGYNIEIKWYHDQRDEDMKDSGGEFAKLVQTPFEFIPR